MTYPVFLFITTLFLGLQIYLGTNSCKDLVGNLLGKKFLAFFYRIFYIIISLAIFVFLIRLYMDLPASEVIYSPEDFQYNMFFQIIFLTIPILAFILIIEGLWELNLIEFLGFKQLWYMLRGKDQSHFKRNRIRDAKYNPKGLYLRHRQPIFFYLFIFMLVYEDFTVNRLLLIIVILAYYFVSTKMQEQRFIEDYGDSYLAYKNKVNKIWPMFKRYFTHEQPKK